MNETIDDNASETSAGKTHRNCWSESILLPFVVIGAMPFLYGAATRLPFIYFVIHLDDHFHLDWWRIGLCVGAYQGSRVVTSAISIAYPKLSHFLGTSAGLAGYITVLICDKDLVLPFVVGTAIVGFSETMSSMQKYAKEMYKMDPDRKKAQLMVKYQYASVMVGVMFAFFVGGFVYQYHQINGVAIFGIVVEGFGLISLLIYACLYNGNDAISITNHCARQNAEEDIDKFIVQVTLDEEKSIKLDTSANHVQVPLDEEKKINLDTLSSNDSVQEDQHQKCSNRSLEPCTPALSLCAGNDENAPTVAERKVSMLTGFIDDANEHYSTMDDIPATWVNWLLCLSFGIEALTIGYNLSIGPIFILKEFNKGTGIIGVLFAVGAASGTFAAIGITCTSAGKKVMRSIAKSPFDLCVAMAGISVGVFVAAIPNFAAHVVGLILLMCFNDVGATLLTELQASITTVQNYSHLGPLGQVVRRCLNVATALSGPVLYGIYPRLPYFVAGGITLLWTIMLVILFKVRRDRSIKAVIKRSGRSRKIVKRRMSFGTTEVVRSMAHISVESNDVTAHTDSCA